MTYQEPEDEARAEKVTRFAMSAFPTLDQIFLPPLPQEAVIIESLEPLELCFPDRPLDVRITEEGYRVLGKDMPTPSDHSDPSDFERD